MLTRFRNRSFGSAASESQPCWTYLDERANTMAHERPVMVNATWHAHLWTLYRRVQLDTLLLLIHSLTAMYHVTPRVTVCVYS